MLVLLGIGLPAKAVAAEDEKGPTPRAASQAGALGSQGAQKKKVVLIAGKPSHGYAQHAHWAGCLLLAKQLNANVPGLSAEVVRNGWPADARLLNDADAIVVYADGGAGHPLLGHLDDVEKLMKRGVGLACLHYAVEMPKGKPEDMLLRWIGGGFEPSWSVNPHWSATFAQFPRHPVANGLKPVTIEDEWYFHMRFAQGMQGVTPILTAIPPDRSRQGPDGPYSGNAAVRARMGMAEDLAWAYQRPDGGRGFGFTGGHWHWNWANPTFRTAVLNGIVWVAGLEVPPGGVPSQAPTLAELLEHQDFPQPEHFDLNRVQKLIDGWQQPAAAK